MAIKSSHAELEGTSGAPSTVVVVVTKAAVSYGGSMCELGSRGSAHTHAPHFPPMRPSRSSETTEQRPLNWYNPTPQF